MSTSLEDILNGKEPQAETTEAPPPEPTAPEPQGEPRDPAQPAPEPSAPEPQGDDEDAPPASEDGKVPLAALQAERKQRQDWKQKASTYEGQLAELRRQLEELKKAPPPAPPQVQQPPQPAPQPPAPQRLPDPIQDPEGYAQAIQQRHEQALLNQRLDFSEQMLRRELGDDTVNEAFAVFQEAAKANPALGQEALRQPDPWRWAYQHAKKLQAMKEIGDDPTAYRSRLEEEIRAKLQAEMAAAPSPAAPALPGRPAAPLPPSLAGARSAPPRSAEWTGPTPIEAVTNPKLR